MRWPARGRGDGVPALCLRGYKETHWEAIGYGLDLPCGCGNGATASSRLCGSIDQTTGALTEVGMEVPAGDGPESIVILGVLQ